MAYTLYRYHHPEIFVDASRFLDKILGGLNTIVLLFSSLTMAWAVRAAQLGQNKFAGKLILITMVCAAMFLGVKAVEYSHKWDLNIFPISRYNFVEGYHPTPVEGTMAANMGISPWLLKLSIVPAILLAAFGACAGMFLATGKKLMSRFFLGLTIMMGGYFLGALSGQIYQNWHESQLAAHADDHGGTHAAHDDEHAAPTGPDSTSSRPEDIGVFFSIYYCMTACTPISRYRRHDRAQLAVSTMPESPLATRLLWARRLCRALLAPCRPDLDLPVPASVSDQVATTFQNEHQRTNSTDFELTHNESEK